ncbi:MAG: hypothetical protein J3Q66DRAFT_387340 [Benniella sp.]|nr:MAG: hypothetical protein J3Q66DRAFT_387340 [Benniella sp.]
MDPRKLKVNELKEQLQLAGLSVNGKKEELIARLLEHQKAEEEALNASVPPTGSGESYDWDESVDDLAPPPPSDPVAPAAKSAKTAVPVEKTAVDKQPSSTSSSSSGPAAAASATSTPSSSSTTAKTADTSATGSAPSAETASNEDALKAEIEKRKSRAARFGIPLTEQDKAMERAARFGVAVNAPATASQAKASGTTTKPSTSSSANTPLKPVPAKPGALSAKIPDDVLNKRRERFGIQAPETKPSGSAGTGGAKVVLDAAEEEKKRKRAAKFGLTPSEEDSNKKQKV